MLHWTCWWLPSWHAALNLLMTTVLTCGIEPIDDYPVDMLHWTCWWLPSWHAALNLLMTTQLTCCIEPIDDCPVDMLHWTYWWLPSWHATLNLLMATHSTTICKLVDLIPALRQSDCRIPNWVSAKTVLSCSTNHGQTTARFRSFFR